MTNKTCLLKLGWKLMSRENRLWCQALRGKYGRRGDNICNVTIKANDSSLWKTIGKDWPTMQVVDY